MIISQAKTRQLVFLSGYDLRRYSTRHVGTSISGVLGAGPRATYFNPLHGALVRRWLVAFPRADPSKRRRLGCFVKQKTRPVEDGIVSRRNSIILQSTFYIGSENNRYKNGHNWIYWSHRVRVILFLDTLQCSLLLLHTTQFFFVVDHSLNMHICYWTMQSLI